MRPVPLLVNAAAIAAGLSLGIVLRPGEGVAEPTAAAQSVPDDPARAAVPEPEAAPGAVIAFRRPFIVPVADGWRTQSLVVVSLELTVGPEDEETLGRVLETRLRDAILPALMGLGEAGGLSGMPGEEDRLREVVSEAAAPLLTGAVPGVSVLKIDKRPV